MKVKIGDVVSVSWDDAWRDTSMYTTTELQKASPLRLRSVGILASLNKSGCVVAQEDKHRDGYRAIHFIPKAMIVKINKVGK